MAKNLHGQTLAATLDRLKRFAFGEPTQDGCDNILVGVAVDEIRGYLKLGTIDSTYVTGTALTDCSIVGINFKLLTGTPQLKIGSTSGGEELYPLSDAIIVSDRFGVSIQCYNKTIYPRLIGAGTAEITLVIERNIF